MYTPNYNNAMMQNEPTEGGSVGSLIGIILIVAIIVLGGVYFWGKRTANQTPAETNAAAVQEVNAIESDLNSTDTSVDADLNSLDAELQIQ